MSFADSCRTSSGILSHCVSDRQRSISDSNRDPDFLAVIFLPPPSTDQNTTGAGAQKHQRHGEDFKNMNRIALPGHGTELQLDRLLTCDYF